MNRELGISERVVWLLSEAGSNNFVMIAKVKGLLSKSTLRQALLLLQKKHPLLDVHIELEHSIPQFVAANTPEIPLRIVELEHSEDWLQEANAEMNLAFDWEKGPLVRLVWLKGEQEQVLLSTFHHVIGDATAGTYFVRDLLSLTSCLMTHAHVEHCVRLPEQPPSDAIIPAQAQGLKGAFQVIGGGLRQGLMLTKQPKKIPAEQTVPPSAVQTHVIHRSLSPEATSRMVAAAKAEQTSVHGLISAMMLKVVGHKIQAIVPAQAPVTLGCFSAVNLRPLLTPAIGEEMGLYVSGISTFHEAGRDTPTWDLAREVKANLTNLLNRGEAFATLMLQKNLLRKSITPLELAQQANQFFLSATCITNLGCLDIPTEYGSLELQDLHFCVAGNAFPGGGMGLAATTFNGRANLNFLFGVPLMSLETAEAMVNEALETLERATSLYAS